MVATGPLVNSLAHSLVYWPHQALKENCAPTQISRQDLPEAGPDITLRDDIYAADKVDWSLFVEKDMRVLIDDMIAVMKRYRGMGLAANQVGETNNRVLILCTSHMENSATDIVAVVNPEIVSASAEKEWFKEGCLSFPKQAGVNVCRPKQVVVRYTSVYGRNMLVNLTGITGICMQHEIDHLCGKTILHHADPFVRESISNSMKKFHRSNQ